MSWNVGGLSDRFGVDFIKRVDGQPRLVGLFEDIFPEDNTRYFISSLYEERNSSVALTPHDAALASILILKDVLGRGLLNDMAKPELSELGELGKVLEKIQTWERNK